MKNRKSPEPPPTALSAKARPRRQEYAGLVDLIPGRCLSPASIHKIENVQKVIVAASQSTLRLVEIAELLQVSRSGARKYARELHDAGILQVVKEAMRATVPPTEMSYTATTDIGRLTAYWRDLQTLLQCPEDLFSRDASTKVYVSGMSTPPAHWAAPAAVRRGPAKRDPLVAALFGASGKQSA